LDFGKVHNFNKINLNKPNKIRQGYPPEKSGVERVFKASQNALNTIKGIKALSEDLSYLMSNY
jgi:hypothetical protein